jgi:hypothetical protein
MASKYGVITYAELEAYASEDYSKIMEDLGELDEITVEIQVEAKITAAEELCGSYTGINLSDFSGTFPDGLTFSVKDISKRMLYTWMRENGMELDKEKVLESKKPYLTDQIKETLNLIKDQYGKKRMHFIKVG